MRFLCTTFILLATPITALAQSSDESHTRYSLGVAVSPGATLVTQISGLARFPSPKKDFDVIGGAALGMVFYSRVQQQEIGAYKDKSPYGTLTFGVGYKWAAITVGFGVRIEERLRAGGKYTTSSWMHTAAAHIFITDAIGLRAEYLGPRWILAGIDITI